jgi:hydrogenase nickel incorporation protein HypA/HybF
MHELALCRSIFGIVDDASQGRTVETISLRVGHLRQVIPETLERCWEVVTHQTALEGSSLEIEHVPVELLCMKCSATTLVQYPLLIACGSCGSAQAAVVRGEELIVTAIDVREEEIERAHG